MKGFKMVNTVDPLKLTYVFTNDAELSFQEKSQFIVKGLVQDLRGLALNPKYNSVYPYERILKDWNIDGQIIEVLQTDSWKNIASIHISANLENPFIPKTYLLQGHLIVGVVLGPFITEQINNYVQHLDTMK